MKLLTDVLGIDLGSGLSVRGASDGGVREDRGVVHGAPALHGLVVAPVREYVLLHVFIQCLRHLIQVTLVLNRHFLHSWS